MYNRYENFYRKQIHIIGKLYSPSFSDYIFISAGHSQEKPTSLNSHHTMERKKYIILTFFSLFLHCVSFSIIYNVPIFLHLKIDLVTFCPCRGVGKCIFILE